MIMPVLDFGDFDGASATASTPVVSKLDEALGHLGFSAVRNIGIEQELIDTAFACSREFFDQPFAPNRTLSFFSNRNTPKIRKLDFSTRKL